MPTVACCSAERSGAAGGGSGGHDRMKQTAEAAAAPASLGVARDAAAPGAAGPPDADGQQALQQYLVNLCQPAALVSINRQLKCTELQHHTSQIPAVQVAVTCITSSAIFPSS